MPGASAAGLSLFWSILLVEEGWAWRTRLMRRTGFRPVEPSYPVGNLPRAAAAPALPLPVKKIGDRRNYSPGGSHPATHAEHGGRRRGRACRLVAGSVRGLPAVGQRSSGVLSAVRPHAGVDRRADRRAGGTHQNRASAALRRAVGFEASCRRRNARRGRAAFFRPRGR